MVLLQSRVKGVQEILGYIRYNAKEPPGDIAQAQALWQEYKQEKRDADSRV